MAVFTHRHGAYITMEDPEFQPLEDYFVAHDKSLHRAGTKTADVELHCNNG
jgi:hypothetical protein